MRLRPNSSGRSAEISLILSELHPMKGRCMYSYEIKRTIARLKVATCATLAVCWLASYAIAGVPAANPVVIVLEENHSYSSVVGNTSSMPYLNSLINKYGLGTKYYANTHPSIGNYFMLTTGQTVTNNDAYSGTVSADNIVRQLVAAG